MEPNTCRNCGCELDEDTTNYDDFICDYCAECAEADDDGEFENDE